MLLFANNATTEVAGSISATATSLNVAAGDGILFPNPGPNDYFVLTLYKNDASELHEIVHCTARNGDSFTIVRAQENTQAQPWNPGDTCSALITAGMLAQFDQGGVNFGPESLVYVGVDTGGPDVVVVPIVSPVVSGGLVKGMTFNIAIAATNSGPTNVTINGFTTYPAARLDGSPLVQGNLTGGEMMKMWFDGAKFVLPVQNVPVHPISTTFYVDPGGNDANDGLTPGSAFKTGPGAILAIENRYASQSGITVKFADGVYLDPVIISGGYIASWLFEGNIANPAACVIDTRVITPTNPSGVSLGAGEGASATFRGFKCFSLQENIGAWAGVAGVEYCILTPPTAGSPAMYCGSGQFNIFYELTYDATGGGKANALVETGNGGTILLAYVDAVQDIPLRIAFLGAPSFNGTFVAEAGGAMDVHKAGLSFTNAASVVGRKFWVTMTGGIGGMGTDVDFFPGDQPGFLDTATYGWYT